MNDETSVDMAELRPLGGSAALDELRKRGRMPYAELKALAESMCGGSESRARRTLDVLEARGAFVRDGDMAVDELAGLYADVLGAIGGRTLDSVAVARDVGARDSLVRAVLEDLERRGDAVELRRRNGRFLWRASEAGCPYSRSGVTPTLACSDEAVRILTERSMTCSEVAEALGLPDHVTKGVLTNLKRDGLVLCMSARSGAGAMWYVGPVAEEDAFRRVSEQRGMEPPAKAPSSKASPVDGRNRDYMTYAPLRDLAVQALRERGPMDERGIMEAIGRTKPIGKMLRRMRDEGCIEPVLVGGSWIWAASARGGRSTPPPRSSPSSSTSRDTRAPGSWARTRWRTAAGAGRSSPRW